MSRRPPPIDTENARASEDPQDSLSQSGSGRRSTRLAGENVLPHIWGSNPEGDARRRNNNQGGITSFLSSMIPGTREDTLPVHNPTADQASQSFANAPSVRNTPLPPPPQQSRGSTSVPPATAAATSSASTSERRGPGTESDPAPPTSEQQNLGTESNPAPSASEQQGSGTTSDPAPPTSEQQNLGTESNLAPSRRQGSGTTSDPAPPTSEQQNLGTESNPAPSRRQGSGTTSDPAPPTSEQQNLGTESNPAPSRRQGSGTTPDLVSSTALQRPPQPRRSASVVNNETRSQPPSLGDRTAAPSPNMSQQPQPNTETRLQQLSLRWTELPEEDRNNLPSGLNLAALRTVFRLAAVGPSNIGGGQGNNSYRNCAFCHEELIDGVGYVRCGHPMHWLCIQRGGLDGGCPVCLDRAAVRPRPPPPTGTRPAADNEECVLCSSTLTPNDHFRLLGCGCEVHEACIISGALANGCPFCREAVPNWHEVATIDLTNSPPSGQTNGDIPTFGGPLVDSPITIGNAPQAQRNAERDRLLSELFHVHPDLWHLFTEEQHRLRQIQNEANFDLDGWLNDFRAYHTVPGSDMSSILLRWQFAEYNPNLNTQDPQIRGVAVGPRGATFYNAIRTTIDSLMNGTDELRARIAFVHANQTRPLHSGNAFHPNFWLPHERMRRRANTDGDRQSVRLHMRRYIDTFHNHPILADLFLPTGEPSENGTTQANNGDRGPLPNDTVQRSSRPVFGPRPGWVYYDGAEKEIRGFRASNGGFQILLRTPAPQEGFWDHELIASHLVGGRTTIDAYKTACEDRGEEPFLFAEGDLELLRRKTGEQVSIVSRSVFRRDRRPPAGGYLNAPMQHLEIKFRGEEGTFWYRKSRLEERFNVPFVAALLAALYRDSGISPVLFSPSATRQRAPRIPSQALQPNTATTRQPPNPTAQPTNPTAQPTNPTGPEGSSLEARMTRMEQMMTQMMALLVMGGRHPTPESLGG